MFLSKVTLQKSDQAMAELARLSGNGVYASHQMLWKLFTQEEERQFLFREEIAADGRPEFFVLSRIAPLASSALFQVQTKSLTPRLTNGQRLAYKLRVNPTICITDETGKSRRHDVLMHAKKNHPSASKDPDGIKVAMEQAAMAWIADGQRLQQWGFELSALPEVTRYTQHRSAKKSGQQLQFSSVDFEGVLTVVDSERFLAQYAQGFGRAKALGCGLMLIKPV